MYLYIFFCVNKYFLEFLLFFKFNYKSNIKIYKIFENHFTFDSYLDLSFQNLDFSNPGSFTGVSGF